MPPIDFTNEPPILGSTEAGSPFPPPVPGFSGLGANFPLPQVPGPLYARQRRLRARYYPSGQPASFASMLPDLAGGRGAGGGGDFGSFLAMLQGGRGGAPRLPGLNRGSVYGEGGDFTPGPGLPWGRGTRGGGSGQPYTGGPLPPVPRGPGPGPATGAGEDPWAWLGGMSPTGDPLQYLRGIPGFQDLINPAGSPALFEALRSEGLRNAASAQRRASVAAVARGIGGTPYGVAAQGAERDALGELARSLGEARTTAAGRSQEFLGNLATTYNAFLQDLYRKRADYIHQYALQQLANYGAKQAAKAGSGGWADWLAKFGGAAAGTAGGGGARGGGGAGGGAP